jgi:hypothetical protein
MKIIYFCLFLSILSNQCHSYSGHLYTLAYFLDDITTRLDDPTGKGKVNSPSKGMLFHSWPTDINRRPNDNKTNKKLLIENYKEIQNNALNGTINKRFIFLANQEKFEVYITGTQNDWWPGMKGWDRGASVNPELMWKQDPKYFITLRALSPTPFDTRMNRQALNPANNIDISKGNMLFPFMSKNNVKCLILPDAIGNYLKNNDSVTVRIKPYEGSEKGEYKLHIPDENKTLSFDIERVIDDK